jgi:hypothetical protein
MPDNRHILTLWLQKKMLELHVSSLTSSY